MSAISRCSAGVSSSAAASSLAARRSRSSVLPARTCVMCFSSLHAGLSHTWCNPLLKQHGCVRCNILLLRMSSRTGLQAAVPEPPPPTAARTPPSHSSPMRMGRRSSSARPSSADVAASANTRRRAASLRSCQRSGEETHLEVNIVVHRQPVTCNSATSCQASCPQPVTTRPFSSAFRNNPCSRSAVAPKPQ